MTEQKPKLSILNECSNARDGYVGLEAVELEEAGSASQGSQVERLWIATEGALRCPTQPSRALRFYVFEGGGNRFAIL